MHVAYELALLATIAVVAWIALDVANDAGRRHRFQSVLVLALSALVWASGELLLHHAQSPDAVLAARRVLFLGVCALPAAWVWSALTVASPDSVARPRRIFFALWAPSLAAYAGLYLAPGGVFVDWYAVPVRRGPLFFANAAYAWLLISAGAVILIRTLHRLPIAVSVLVLAAAVLPVGVNAAYVLLHVTPWDPTPVALAFSALVFRLAVMDVAWGAYRAPAAAAEIVKQMQAGVLVADLEGRVVDWNRAASRILGVHAPARRMLRELLDESAQRAPEIDVYEFPLERHGQPFGTGVVVTDRTKMREAELRLEMTTRVEALGYLAAGVAHEINNPLSYVSVNLTLLDRLVAAVAAPEVQSVLPAPLRLLTAEAEELLADAREGTERIQRIVERMTQISNHESAGQSVRAFDVCFAVEKAVELASFGKMHGDTKVIVEGVVPHAYAFETDVIHVVLHLLHNAVQMGGEDVPVTIRVRAAEGGVAVRVEDGGPGVAESDLPHVFEPFFTTRRPSASLGLGLSLCWELARRNGGRLEVANRSEGGAAFTLWLPPARA
jgi:signal transduction histidine kinase